MRKYKLEEADWAALQVFQEILQVNFTFTFEILTITNLFDKIPHAFQQIVSHEKIPTLCLTLVAFEALILKWKEYKEENPETSTIIQEGLDKLDIYLDDVEETHAYVLAMGVYLILSVVHFTT